VLVLATVLPGYSLGMLPEAKFSWILLGWTLLGTYLMSSASFIFNQYIERDSDAKMYRTNQRPIPGGKISPTNALLLGLLTTVLAFGILWYFLNILTALCAFSALALYVFLYTMYLKPRTEQNIVIGGISGCMGPLIGFAATSNTLPWSAWILFLTIFLWTPAHFWALAIFLKDDYEHADIPMLPVTHGIESTTKQILVYTILYTISLLVFPLFEPTMGMIYLAGGVSLCMWMIYWSIQLIRNQDPIFAKKFFFFSIFHLFLMNVLILVDHKV
jgi:protoheme IX farnesyltransferase